MKSKNIKGLSSWLNAHSSSKSDDQVLEEIWESSSNFAGGFEPDVDSALSLFQQRIGTGNKTKVVQMRSRSWMKMAAAVAFLLVASYAFFQFGAGGTSSDLVQVSTLENENKEMTLSDGSLVSLNAKSSISHPETFAGKVRSVELTGEAFFEVKKNEGKSFQIQTKSGLVEVLGTSFNIRDIEEENTMEVFVKTGKVAVTVPVENKRYLLEPGQILIHDKKAGTTVVHQEKTANPIAWKTKVLRFQNAPLSEIFAQMERVFDVKISAKNERLKECPFTTTVRATKLRDAFKALEASCDLTFKIDTPGEFIVSGDCCE